MGGAYDVAFEAFVRGLWNALTQTERDNAQLRTDRAIPRQGDLDPSAHHSHAIVDTFNYQRSHADSFKKALDEAGVRPPGSDQTMAIVDIGAGAATVGVAIAEAWSDYATSISYHMIEPNKPMRKLGRKILSEMATPFAGLSSHRSIDKFADKHPSLKVDRILVALSYVLHQTTVRNEHVKSWVRQIRRLSRLPNRPHVEVLATTVSSSNSALWERDSRPAMRSSLQKNLPDLEVNEGTFKCGLRFPLETPVLGNQWKAPTTPDWENVNYVYWG